MSEIHAFIGVIDCLFLSLLIVHVWMDDVMCMYSYYCISPLQFVKLGSKRSDMRCLIQSD